MTLTGEARFNCCVSPFQVKCIVIVAHAVARLFFPERSCMNRCRKKDFADCFNMNMGAEDSTIFFEVGGSVWGFSGQPVGVTMRLTRRSRDASNSFQPAIAGTKLAG